MCAPLLASPQDANEIRRAPQRMKHKVCVAVIDRRTVSVIYALDRVNQTPAATSNSPTCGRVKLPHPRVAGRGMLCGGGARRNSRCGFLQAPALAFKLQEMAMVHEAVE